MGIYGALATAVTGLRAQSFALENISGNIANSQTTGYKRIETSFLDLIPDAPVKQQVPGAVVAQSRGTNQDAGDITNASVDTFMALNGNGFFVVEEKIGENDGNSVFGGASYYTRRGDFDLDEQGYMVNGAGYFLKGLPIDASTGNISGSVPEVIQISNSFLPAQETTRIDYKLNLPELPQPAAYDSETADSELLVAGDFTVDPTVAGTGVVQAQDSDLFIEHSVAGGAITVYAENGASANVQLRWAKIDSVDSGGTDTWNLFYLSDSSATTTDTMWTNAGTEYEFDGAGTLTTATSVTLTGLAIDGTTIGNVTLQHDTGGVTQFADANGSSQVTSLSQNGFSAGEFVSVTINDSGRVVAAYTNGQQVELAQIVVANFNAANSLKRLDGGLFAVTSESGEAILDSSGGGILGGSLESSNTDISEEFTKLIVTQQAYSAGTRIVSTADEMLQEALNMVR